MRALDLATKVPTVSSKTGLEQCLMLLDQHELYDLPVVEGGRVLGMLSRPVLVRLRSYGTDLGGGIEQYMDRDVVAVEASTDLEDVPAARDGVSIALLDDQGEFLGVLHTTSLYLNLLRMKDPVLFQRHNLLPDLVQVNSSELMIEQVPLFKSILDSAHDGVLITDGHGVILFVNSSYERISGYERSSVIGVHVRERFRQGLIFPSIVRQVLRHKRGLTLVQKYFGEGRYALTSARPVLDQSGGVIRVVCCLKDISDFVRMHHDLQASRQLARRYLLQLHELREQDSGLGELVARSRPFRQVLNLARRVAEFDTTVLIMGESGVGKEMVARFIHEHSPRRGRPFVTINCAAIPPSLMESELFGYAKGSFTGAIPQGKPGMFEVANTGTILMDEISELPLEAQAKLLRALQEKEITRIGDRSPLRINVRVLASTNRDLSREVKAGRFREDLFFRLNVVPLVVPPLRERKEDIPLLALQMLARHNKQYGKKKTLSQEVLQCLTAYGWPGNVRELSNVIEYMLVTSDANEIRFEHLPAQLRRCVPAARTPGRRPGRLKEVTADYESQLIQDAVAQHGSLRKAARHLGVHPSTLSRKIRRKLPRI
jgi:PAS domain S-box-containing protein